ncbi:unnamed protein product [Cochlearia groenlandica]
MAKLSFTSCFLLFLLLASFATGSRLLERTPVAVKARELSAPVKATMHEEVVSNGGSNEKSPERVSPGGPDPQHH